MLDSLNMYDDIKNSYKQCKSSTDIKVEGKIDKIIVVGMGGSAIGGDLLGSLLKEIPVFTVRSYHMPEFIDETTLIFINSFSGNTEETISSFREALKTKAKIVAISKGGRVKEIADENKIPFVQITSINEKMQPRAALGLSFFPILKVLQNSGIAEELSKDIEETVTLLKDNDEIRTQAEEMAKDLTYKVPVVYASEKFKVAAERWKTQFNENSKIMACYNVFSEMNHNEIMGYEHVPAHFHVILLRDDDDNPRIKKRMDICRNIMKNVGIEEVYTRGNSNMAKYFSLIHFGDWVTYHLALLNDKDPSEIDAINYLKEQLG